MLFNDARTKARFDRVFAASDGPVAIDEAQALSLVILASSASHSGKDVTKAGATDAMTETLMR